MVVGDIILFFSLLLLEIMPLLCVNMYCSLLLLLQILLMLFFQNKRGCCGCHHVIVVCTIMVDSVILLLLLLLLLLHKYCSLLLSLQIMLSLFLKWEDIVEVILSLLLTSSKWIGLCERLFCCCCCFISMYWSSFMP